MSESEPTSPSIPQQEENNDFQPFYVLHEASVPQNRKSEKRGVAKTRKRIDLEEDYQTLQFEAFNIVWSKIESTVKDVLIKINGDVFDKIHCWIKECFDVICSCGPPHPAKLTVPYPLLQSRVSGCRQLCTAFVFTKNIELVDDIETFANLASHLKSRGCHVANLLSSDISSKNGVGGCVKSLLRQFLMSNFDAADISILASWYAEQGDYEKPVVLIIDNLERCCGPVLSDFIIMLREWAVKIPIILIIGVATTLEAPQHILSSTVLHSLLPVKFYLTVPAARMDAILEAVLVRPCAFFSIGHKAASFVRNYFVDQDGTVTSFIRALKIAVMQHITTEPLGVVLRAMVDVEETKDIRTENVDLLETALKEALELCPNRTDSTVNDWVNRLAELHHMQKSWSSVAMCLYEAGKLAGVSLLDLYCEMLDPEPYHSKASETGISLKRNYSVGQSSHRDGAISKTIISAISKAILKVRDLPPSELRQLLEKWEHYAKGFTEVYNEVKELKSLMVIEGNKRPRREPEELSMQAVRASINAEKDRNKVNEKAATLMTRMLGKCVQLECIPWHETVCFQKVDKLQSALLGDPRRRIQLDLLEFHKFLKCSCCSKNSRMLSLSMYDTSVMYTLAQEHGDLINLHDWYQSFKATITQPPTKSKKRSKQHSPKGKHDTNAPAIADATIQARFCRAVTELQLVGLLRMPSKRRPDYVQRIAFGL